jgi:SAM-dependent methyltransferase
MNRERGLHGVNSYTRELGFDALAWLMSCAEAHGQAAWLDVCCGEGRALSAAAQALRESHSPLNIHLAGVDLVAPGSYGARAPGSLPTPSIGNKGPAKPSAVQLEFIEADIDSYMPSGAFDLITCVHGLHYLADKLGFLERAYGWLTAGGILVGHLDPANVRSDTMPRSFWPTASRHARHQGAEVGLKSHRLRIERNACVLDFGAEHVGAGPSETANYTGIAVIDSWYRFKG